MTFEKRTAGASDFAPIRGTIVDANAATSRTRSDLLAFADCRAKEYIWLVDAGFMFLQICPHMRDM
jgi:hypothetical protein